MKKMKPHFSLNCTIGFNITTAFVLLSSISFAQNNVLPTNGNVGIGTTSPETQLDVKGNVNVDSTLTVGDSAIFESSTLVKESFTVEGVSRLEENVDLVKDLKVDGETNLLGNLNTYSTVKLNNTPNTTGNYTGFKVLGIDELGVVKAIELPMSSGAEVFLPPKNCNSDATGFNSATPYWDNGYNKLFVECPGVNVGIGTNSPTHKLTLIGSQLTYGNSEIKEGLGIGAQPVNFAPLNIQLKPINGAGIQIKGNNPGQFTRLIYGEIFDNTAEIIKVFNTQTNTAPFMLYGNGKMVINNGTNKILQLNADGVLQTRTIKVDVYNWPDFVFEPNYKKMSLNELENYVIENHHLPNVPSAKVAEAEGIDLSEMNKILLQKVEELTLYILEQNKRIEVLEESLQK